MQAERQKKEMSVGAVGGRRGGGGEQGRGKDDRGLKGGKAWSWGENRTDTTLKKAKDPLPDRETGGKGSPKGFDC